LFFFILEETVTHQVGSKALVQAKEIASYPEVIKALENKNHQKLRSIFSSINLVSDSDYVVIANDEEVRLYHPNPAYIGKKINSKDNHKALVERQSYVSVSKGESGVSIRGKTPVISSDNNVIGVISVGYLTDRLSDRILQYAYPILGIVFVAILLSIIGAYFFSEHIKSQMFNMEPSEIARTLEMKKSIMASMYEGIIAIDNQGLILNINASAIEMLKINQDPDKLIDKPIDQYVTPADFFGAYNRETQLQDVRDEVITCNNDSFIATRVKMTNNNNIIGLIVSLRRRDDITALTTQLAQVQHYLDNLRVIRHEHNNQLSTICGLLQIKEYDTALDILESTSSKQQALIDFVTQRFKPKIITGLLLGKLSRAEELGLILEIDTMSELSGEDWQIKEDELCAMLGNLLDNAYEATIRHSASDKVISLFLTDKGDELVIQVIDHGIGFEGQDPHLLLQRGMTTKDAEGHGIGLYLVNQYVQKAGGNIMIEEAEPQGAIFSIYIPKSESKRIKENEKI
jgi:two-component system cit operon sensor histidine kinase CitA